MAHNQDIGDKGENTACTFLEKKGYRLLCANFSSRLGEIDLVMEDRATIVFVEVKRRIDERYGQPEEAVTPTKQRHMAKAALSFIRFRRLFERAMRFDIVAIGPSGIKHIE